jgi:hypothetical protein
METLDSREIDKILASFDKPPEPSESEDSEQLLEAQQA